MKTLELTERFYRVIENTPPLHLAKSIRVVFFGYLQTQIREGMTIDLERNLYAVSEILELFDFANEVTMMTDD